MAKIYLSSTYEDLKECRGAVYRALRALRHDVISMEDYAAGDERPVDRCLRDVASCDVYVGVFAFRFGFVPEGQQASITELELREATKCGKPILAFLLGDEAPWPPKHVDMDRSQVDRVRSYLETSHTVAYFESSDGLATEVGAAVTRLGLPTADAPREPEDLSRKAGFLRTIVGGQIDAARFEQRYYAIVASLLVALGLGLTIFGFLYEPVVGFSALLVPAASVFPASTMVSRRKRSALLGDLKTELEVEPPSPSVLREVEGLLNQSLELQAA